MAVYDEFLQMAKEMLDDPEIGGDASVVITTTTVLDPAKPWDKETVTVTKPIRCFRTSSKGKMVDGSLVVSGESVFISYPPEGGITKEQALAGSFIDPKGQKWRITGFEPLCPADVDILYTYKVAQ